MTAKHRDGAPSADGDAVYPAAADGQDAAAGGKEIGEVQGDAADHRRQGEAYLDQEDYAAARVAFARSLQLQPGAVEVHNKLGITYAREERLQEARQHFQQALALDPEFVPAHSNLGNVYKEQGELDAAVAAYRRAIELDPNYATAHHNLGVVLKQQGKLAEAVGSLKAARRMHRQASRRGLPISGNPRMLGFIFVGLLILLLIILRA